MVFLTSIAPKHILENRQQDCVKSWLTHGEVISFNHPSEIEILETQGYDKRIKFLPTYRTQKAFFGKHYVCVNAITDYIREHNIQEACMINSDIEITQNPKPIADIKERMKKSFVYLHRWDFDGDKSKAGIYMDGVDAFFFTPEHCETLPQTMYCLGHTYFDIWLPWHFLIHPKLELISVRNEPIIYHQRHSAQYNAGDWVTMGKYTGMLTGFSFLQPADLSQKIYNTIRKHTNYL